MRQVGTLSDEKHAKLLLDYLVTRGISASTELDDGSWIIWVHDEDHLESAVETFQLFEEDPTNARYATAASQAETIREGERKKREQARRNVIEMRSQWSRGIARRAPLVFVLIGLSLVVSIATGTLYGRQNWKPDRLNRLTFADPSISEGGGSSGVFRSVADGQWWRLITPIFIHFGWPHVIFNMYMLYYLGSQIENRRGSLRFGLIVLVIAAASNAGQAAVTQYFPSSAMGNSPLFGGMSGVDYGLFGYIWMKTLYDPRAGMRVTQGTIIMLVGWFFLCLTGWVGNIANAAHGFGLAVGIVMGYTPEVFRPSKNDG